VLITATVRSLGARGDLAVVANRANGRSAYAIFADVGPKSKIGEVSIALTRQLGIPSNLRHDSMAGGVTYLVFLGSALAPGARTTTHRIPGAAAPLYRNWGGEKIECVPGGAAKAN